MTLSDFDPHLFILMHRCSPGRSRFCRLHMT